MMLPLLLWLSPSCTTTKTLPMVTFFNVISPKLTFTFPTWIVMLPIFAPIGPVPTETGPPLTVGAGTEMLGMDTDGGDEVVLGTADVVGADEEAVDVFETDVDDDDVAAAARAVIVFDEAG